VTDQPSDPNEFPQINWDQQRLASLNLAEAVRIHYEALVASGFDDEQAMALASDYQHHLLCHMGET
jgi:hypothetical protein